MYYDKDTGAIVEFTEEESKLLVKANEEFAEKFKNRPKRLMHFTKSKEDKTKFLCECGYPVLEAFFDNLGYLHTSLHVDENGRCFQCKRRIDEELLNENEVEVI